MERVKFIFQQSMMISFGILVGMGFEGFIYRDNIRFMWYHPISVIFAGIVCSLPTLFLCSENEMSRKKYILRIVLHFISLFAVVMILGKLFRWYTVLEGALFVAGEFVFVYIFVWVATTWMGLRDGKEINNALDDIRDDE